MEIYIIYKASNNKNNKLYIGQTRSTLRTRSNKHKNDSDRGSTTAFGRALRKHQFCNFKFEAIASCKSQEDANYLETALISQYNSMSPSGYNLHSGGGVGFTVTNELRKVRSDNAKGFCKKTKVTVKYKNGIGVSFFSIYEAADYLKTNTSAIHNAIKRPDSMLRDFYIFKSNEYNTFNPVVRCFKFHQPIVAVNVNTKEEFSFIQSKQCADFLNIDRGCIRRAIKSNRIIKLGYKFKNISFEEYLNHTNKIVPQ